ncbi:Prolamin-like domain [Macleaya cordata]|uniref:Prolamin-like domain n=1 Tax=Macleaya cordata TaxID=56857 RepID=A0A200R8X4_MACCD|nr:Prolamin-like domain [Macleaya cordata]
MKREQYIFPILLIVVHVFASIPTGLAQYFPDLPLIGILPPGFNKELEQCWSFLHRTEGCVSEIYTVFNNNTQIGLLSPNCCKTITELDTKCFGKMFYNLFFIPFLRAYCIQRDEPTSPSPKPISPTPKITTDTYKETETNKEPQFLAPWLGLDYKKCLSSLQSVEGCIEEVFGSLISFQFRLPGRACCKAVTEISDNCWSKLLPLNPFMNPLLKGYCANIVQVAPGPTKQA